MYETDFIKLRVILLVFPFYNHWFMAKLGKNAKRKKKLLVAILCILCFYSTAHVLHITNYAYIISDFIRKILRN